MTASKTNSFERRPGVDSRNVKHDDPSQDVSLAQGAAQGIALVGNVAGIESEPTSTLAKQALAEEKFLSEQVEIYLQSPGDWENDHRFAEVTVNGERVCLIRDDEVLHKIKRYHLAQIATAKLQKVVQKKITHADGSIGYEEKAQLQALYPFSVFHDPNPKGAVWLRQLMQRG